MASGVLFYDADVIFMAHLNSIFLRVEFFFTFGIVVKSATTPASAGSTV